MLTKFLDFDKIYNFCLNEKIVTQKNLSLQAFVIATLENSFGRSTLGILAKMNKPNKYTLISNKDKLIP